LLCLNSFVIGGSAFNSAIILDSALNCFIICELLVKKEKKIHLKEKRTKLTPFKHEKIRQILKQWILV